MATDFVPARGAQFRDWASVFTTGVVAAPVPLGLTVAQATTLSGLFTAFDSAWNTSEDPATRTKGTIQTRTEKRDALTVVIRQFAKIIQANPAVANQQRIDLGLPVHKTEATPINAPTVEPVIEIGERSGTSIEIHLHAEAGDSRRLKPPGVQGASVYALVSPTASTDPADYTFHGITTRTTTTIQFDASLPAGTVVWITANWYSPRGQTGPGASPVRAVLAGGGMLLAA